MEPLRKELTARMSELISYIPDGEHLKDKWILTKILSVASSKVPYGNFGSKLSEAMAHNREIIASIEAACNEHPEKMEELFADVAEFEKYRRKDGISIYSFRRKNDILNIAGKSVAAVLGLPYFICSALFSLPMWIVEKLIRSKIKDKAFRNTVSFGVKLGFGLTWIPALIITAFCTMPWFAALICTLLFILPSYSFFHDYIEGMRRFISDIKIVRCKKLRKRFKAIVSDFKKL